MKRVIAILLILVLVGAMGYGLFKGTRKAKPAANGTEAAATETTETTSTADANAVNGDVAAQGEGTASDVPTGEAQPAAEGTPSDGALADVPAADSTALPENPEANATAPAAAEAAAPASVPNAASVPALGSSLTSSDEFSYSPKSSSIFGTTTQDSQTNGTAQGLSAAAAPVYNSGNENGYITLIDDIEVPSEEAGVLRDFDLQEGAQVKKGDLIAKLDDEQALMLIQQADAKLKSAERQASNDVNIRYANAATRVAYAEIQQADEANAKTPNTVTQAEVRRLMLAHKQAELQIEQATHDFTVAKYTVDVQRAELDAANLALKKRSILSPMDGIVVEKFRHAGEWVKPGDPLLRLIRMDTMRIKFTLDVKTNPMSEVMNRAVEVTVPLLPGKTFQGKVTFLSPVIESGTRYQVWAEITNQQENGCWILQPGMQANAVVK